MGWGACGLLAVMTAGLASSAAAQTPAEDLKGEEGECRKAAIEARGVSLSGRQPYAVLWSSGALRHDCRIVSFHDATPNRESQPRIWVSYRYRPSPFSDGSNMTYADSGMCAGVLTGVRQLEAFQPLRIMLSSLHRSQAMMIFLDGAYYGLWSNEARAGAGGSAYVLDVEGWNYPRLMEVERETMADLTGCLTAKAPG